MTDEYALENLDGSEQVKVPKWLYDHVIHTENRVKELEVQNGQLAGYLSTAEDDRNRLRARVAELAAALEHKSQDQP